MKRSSVPPPRALFLSAGAAAVGLTAALLGCGGGSAATSGSGGGSAAPCFDYTSFQATSPVTTFKADVLPILQVSCGVGSSACHGAQTGHPPAQPFFAPPLGCDQICNCDTKGHCIVDSAVISAAFASSVGVKAQEEPDMEVIKPGDPEHSYLLYKIDWSLDCTQFLSCSATSSCKSTMPYTGPQLPQSERDTIRRWIAQGAKND